MTALSPSPAHLEPRGQRRYINAGWLELLLVQSYRSLCLSRDGKISNVNDHLSEIMEYFGLASPLSTATAKAMILAMLGLFFRVRCSIKDRAALW